MTNFNFLFLLKSISAKRSSVFILVFAFLVLTTADIFAQQNFFTNAADIMQKQGAIKKVNSNSVYRLNEQAMRNYLVNAPMEFRNNNTFLPLEIPLPNGKTEIFNIVESPVLSTQVAADHPEIKTYTGNGQSDKRSVIRLSLTSSGFNASFLM